LNKLKLFVIAGLLLPLTTVFADSDKWEVSVGEDSSSYKTVASLQQESSARNLVSKSMVANLPG